MFENRRQIPPDSKGYSEPQPTSTTLPLPGETGEPFRLLNFDYRLSSYTVHWVVSGLLNVVVDDTPLEVAGGHFFVSSPQQRVLENYEETRRARTVTITIPERIMRKVYFDLKYSSNQFFRHCPELECWPLRFSAEAHVQEKYITDILLEITGAAETRSDAQMPQSRYFELLAERLLLKENTFTLARVNPPLPLGKQTRANWETLARSYIEKNYHRPLTLKNMADSVYLSSHHYLRRFKSVFGVTPYQFLISKRLDVARSLLGSTALPVEEISARVGYPSVNGFYRAFRRKFHHSPSAFRSTQESR